MARRVVRIRLARRSMLFLVPAVACAIGTAAMGVLLMLARDAPWHLPLVPLALATTFLLLSVRRMRLVVDGDVVRGFPDRATVRIGAGQVRVDWEARSLRKGNQGSYAVTVESGIDDIEIDSLVHHPGDARALGEKLAKLLRVRLRVALPGEVETRECDELDAPIADRIRKEESSLVEVRRPDDATCIADVDAHGTVRLRWPLTARRVRSAAMTAGLLWFIFSGIAACARPKSGPEIGAERRLQVFAILSAGVWGAFLGWLAFRALLPLEVEVGRERVVWRWRLFGRIPVFARALAAPRIETIASESHHIALVGDGVWRRVPAFGSPGEHAWVRFLLERGLTGLPAEPPAPPRTAPAFAPAQPTPAAIPSHAAAGAAAASPAPRPHAPCPRCRETSLVRIGGPLEESRCRLCNGRFLPRGGVERLVEGELGVARDVLQELARSFTSARRVACAQCASAMSPVRLKSVAVDLCGGCGGLWLDKDELSALSSGRYAG